MNCRVNTYTLLETCELGNLQTVIYTFEREHKEFLNDTFIEMTLWNRLHRNDRLSPTNILTKECLIKVCGLGYFRVFLWYFYGILIIISYYITLQEIII